MSAQDGHLAVTIDLVKAGADLDAPGVEGATPLHLASQYGHTEVVATLVEAGAKVNSRAGDGRTPLYMAALDGRLGVVKELLRANANPRLTSTTRRGFVRTPLDVAVTNGHQEVVCELIQRAGIEGWCVGSRGVEVLAMAAGHVGVMAILMDAGVVDTGEALCAAAGNSRRAAVQFLLQRRQLEGSPTGLVGYVNFRDPLGCTPLFRSIERFATDDDGIPPLISVKVIRLLIDAGADTSSAVRFTNTRGWLRFHGTPLTFTNLHLRTGGVGQIRDSTDEQMNTLEAVRRTLLRVDAARAVSWLWVRELLLVGGAEEVSSRKRARKTQARGMHLASMLPILRRRRRGVLVASLFRYANYA